VLYNCCRPDLLFVLDTRHNLRTKSALTFGFYWPWDALCMSGPVPRVTSGKIASPVEVFGEQWRWFVERSETSLLLYFLVLSLKYLEDVNGLGWQCIGEIYMVLRRVGHWCDDFVESSIYCTGKFWLSKRMILDINGADLCFSVLLSQDLVGSVPRIKAEDALAFFSEALRVNNCNLAA